MKKIAVSVHATDNFDPKIIEDLKGLDFIHVDIMDGKFVNNYSNNLDVLKILKEKYKLPIIAHLMVINPLKYIEKVMDHIDFFIFHYESEGDGNLIINEVKKKKKKIGIAINPNTELEVLIPFLEDIDLVLIMTVNPGWSGQEFKSEMIKKVNLLRTYKDENKLNFLIDVDGGINTKNCKLINSDILSSASAILKASDPNSVIQAMKYSSEEEK